MIKKGTKLYSIINNKCPKCQEGDFFEAKAYHLHKFGEKYEHCASCGLKYEREPGFFYGSMYVSYAIGVAIFVTWWIAKSILFPNMEAGTMVIIMAIIQIVLAPLNIQLSKLIWLNLFFKYNKKIVE